MQDNKRNVYSREANISGVYEFNGLLTGEEQNQWGGGGGSEEPGMRK